VLLNEAPGRGGQQNATIEDYFLDNCKLRRSFNLEPMLEIPNM